MVWMQVFKVETLNCAVRTEAWNTTSSSQESLAKIPATCRARGSEALIIAFCLSPNGNFAFSF